MDAELKTSMRTSKLAPSKVSGPGTFQRSTPGIHVEILGTSFCDPRFSMGGKIMLIGRNKLQNWEKNRVLKEIVSKHL